MNAITDQTKLGAIVQNVLIIVPCTDRKRQNPAPNLTARSLPSSNAATLAKIWVEQVSSQVDRVAARDLYCGRAFKEALDAAGCLNADLKVISAGLGVVDQHEEIPSYSVTVAPGYPDSILKRITIGEASPSAWWCALQRELPRARHFHDELNASGSNLILTALTEKYAEMIHSDLEKLDDEMISRLRVFGAGIAKHLPKRLAPTVMPYDERLDGPQSPCPGTMSDFGQRALRHFAGLLHSGQVLGADLDADRSDLERHMSGWLPRKIPVRAKLSDEEVINFIHESWEKTAGRSQATLRLLRDSGLGCEQGRFRDLFHKARVQRQLQGASLR